MMRWLINIALFLWIALASAANVSFEVYEPDGLTLFDGRNIRVGTELKLIVTSDANDFWSGGFFLDNDSRHLAVLSGSGREFNSRDYPDNHWANAGQDALVTRWEDSVIEGFDLFSDVNCIEGDWFVINYTAIAPGEVNIGFYEYSVSWDDPNAFATIYQVPTADFNTDGVVNFQDYSLLASCWVDGDCADPDGCGKADLDASGTIDVNDLLLFADNWLWGVPEPNVPPEPIADPNLIYRIVDANGSDEITIDVGHTVTLYVDMVTYDVNEVWTFDVEVNISDPNLGLIDNTAYDPNNPPGEGTARILAGPNRWTIFDRWGPGFQQEQGIHLSGVNGGGAFQSGHLASFEFTCLGQGDVKLELINWDTSSTSGEKLHPTLEGILIHQNISELQLMTSSDLSMTESSMTDSEEPTYSTEQMVEFLEEIWLTDDGIQDMIDKKDWDKFLKSVRQGD